MKTNHYFSTHYQSTHQVNTNNTKHATTSVSIPYRPSPLRQVMRSAHPGMKEYQMEAAFQHYVYSKGGCRNCSYTCICATGANRLRPTTILLIRECTIDSIPIFNQLRALSSSSFTHCPPTRLSNCENYSTLISSNPPSACLQCRVALRTRWRSK